MKKDLDMTKPCYRKHILPVPCPFFISKFHCNRIQLCDDFLFTLLYSLAGYETHEEHKSGKSTILFHKNTTSVLYITAVLQRPQQRNKHTKQSIALFLLDNKKAIAFSRLDTKCPSLEKPPLARYKNASTW